MRFLRTASTRRLLAVIAGAFAVIVAGTAIAVAAGGSGPVPASTSLAPAVHKALTAPSPEGISADISFTNNLIDSSDFAGHSTDPILQGATGRLWLTKDRLRLELQSDNGDAQVLVNGRSFWISDPNQQMVYEGTLPADGGKPDGSGANSGSGSADNGIPSVAEIQSKLNQLMQHIDIAGPQPTDVAGQAAYRVTVSPKHDGGLLGSAQLAWDAARGVPLDFGIYARGNNTPVIELKATSISYGAVPSSVFTISPPGGDKVVKVSGMSQSHAHMGIPGAAHAKRTKVSGVRAVAARLPFTLDAPSSLMGLPRRQVSLLNWGGKPSALVVYGENLGGVAVLEQAAGSGGGTVHTGAGEGGLSMPTVSINGATGQELSTPLGTLLRFTKAPIAYTVVGSVPAPAAEQAARALTAP